MAYLFVFVELEWVDALRVGPVSLGFDLFLLIDVAELVVYHGQKVFELLEVIFPVVGRMLQ
jgi:hypothetical protein